MHVRSMYFVRSSNGWRAQSTQPVGQALYLGIYVAVLAVYRTLGTSTAESFSGAESVEVFLPT